MSAIPNPAGTGAVIPAPRLVALRALGLGDAVTAVPALRALREAFPRHLLVLAGPHRLAPLLQPDRLADQFCDAHGLAPLPADLAPVDVAVDLHGRGPGSQPLLAALRPRRLVAFCHPDLPCTAGGPAWRAGEHEVARWCRMLADSGIPADPRRLDLTPPPGPVPPFIRGATIVHPGAASAARRWPPERFAAIARAELCTGRHVVITGSGSERSTAARVAHLAGVPRSHVLAGRSSLAGLARIVAAAGRVVCGDTGVAHLATAYGVPSVVLFGPVPPSEWGPPADRPLHVALWAGHRGDPHGRTLDPGLAEITVADVAASLASLPSRAPEPAACRAAARRDMSGAAR